MNKKAQAVNSLIVLLLAIYGVILICSQTVFAATSHNDISNYNTIGAEKNSAPIQSATTKDKVSVSNNNFTAQAHLQAYTQAQVSSQLDGKIIKTPFRDGQSFKQNDVLIQFECTNFEADLKKAKALVEARRIAYDANLRLKSLGGVGQVELEKTKAELAEAEGDMAIREQAVSYCQIKAPYNGMVVKITVYPFENVRKGDQILEILDNSNLQVEAIVPSDWLVWLNKGVKFDLSINETGKSYPGNVIAIMPKVDSISQSVRILGKIDGQFNELISGMSGKATFKKPQ